MARVTSIEIGSLEDETGEAQAPLSFFQRAPRRRSAPVGSVHDDSLTFQPAAGSREELHVVVDDHAPQHESRLPDRKRVHIPASRTIRVNPSTVAGFLISSSSLNTGTSTHRPRALSSMQARLARMARRIEWGLAGSEKVALVGGHRWRLAGKLRTDFVGIVETKEMTKGVGDEKQPNGRKKLRPH
jgi:hypothetical protein